MKRTLFSGCLVMRDARREFDPTPQDILTEGDRILAIEPSGVIAEADNTVDVSGTLAAAGLIGAAPGLAYIAYAFDHLSSTNKTINENKTKNDN